MGNESAIEFTEPMNVYRVWIDLGSNDSQEAFFTQKSTAEEFAIRMKEAGHMVSLNEWPWLFKIER